MDEHDWLAQRFEEHRAHLRAVAYRMLGSPSEAEDAVQEAWLRLSRSGADGVENLGGWLTTVVGRVCLDMLRSRAGPEGGGPPGDRARAGNDDGRRGRPGAARRARVAGPAERLAFVLHDLFAVPFEFTIVDGRIAEIALVADPERIRQLDPSVLEG